MLDLLKAEALVDKNATWDKVPFFKPRPGGDSEDGYQSRIGIHEVLKVTDTVRDLIIKNATSQAIEEQAKKDGMMTMIEDGVFKAVQGVTTIEEVLRVISE